MPLTLEELQEIQADLMADDIEIVRLPPILLLPRFVAVSLLMMLGFCGCNWLCYAGLCQNVVVDKGASDRVF